MQQAMQQDSYQLKAEDYFQAIHRLKHYLTFPAMVIEDETIDLAANEFWHRTLHPDIKEKYKEVRRQRKALLQPFQMEFNKLMLPKPESPLQWYIRARTVLDWAFFQELSSDELSSDELIKFLRTQWANLPAEKRAKYNKLAIIDQKRCRAFEIERRFMAQGLSIGGQSFLQHNITVKTLQENIYHPLVSSQLFKRINVAIFTRQQGNLQS